MKKLDKVVVAIVCVTVLGVCAILKGLNGAIFWPAMATVAGLTGYKVKGKIDEKAGGE